MQISKMMRGLNNSIHVVCFVSIGEKQGCDKKRYKIKFRNQEVRNKMLNQWNDELFVNGLHGLKIHRTTKSPFDEIDELYAH